MQLFFGFDESAANEWRRTGKAVADKAAAVLLAVAAMPEPDDLPQPPPPAATPTNLGGVPPDEMIARAMQTVRMTNSAGAHGWEP